MSDPLFHITPGQVAAFVPMAFVLAWLASDDDEPDDALSLERLPSSVVRERDDLCSQEQAAAHLPSVLEELGLL